MSAAEGAETSFSSMSDSLNDNVLEIHEVASAAIKSSNMSNECRSQSESITPLEPELQSVHQQQGTEFEVHHVDHPLMASENQSTAALDTGSAVNAWP